MKNYLIEFTAQDAVYTEQIGRYKIEIFTDSDPLCPVTDEDIFGTFSRYYERGGPIAETNDKNPSTRLSGEFEYCRENRMSVVFGLNISRYSRLSATLIPWYEIDEDTHEEYEGIYYVDSKTITDEFKRATIGGKRLTARQRAIKLMKAVVGEMGHYYDGECYGYVVADLQTGKEIGSCWGFLGEYDGYILDEAKSEIWSEVKKEIEAATDKRKTRLLRTYKSIIPK